MTFEMIIVNYNNIFVKYTYLFSVLSLYFCDRQYIVKKM